MKKRVIAAMLAGIMVFSVTACGKDESTGSSDTQTTGGTEESSADTEAAADTADAADTESEEAEQPAAPVEIVVTTTFAGEDASAQAYKDGVKAWEEQGPEYFSNIQKSIVTQAAGMLKKGGMMLYSTCTFDSRENEEIIANLRKEYPEFRILDIRPYEGFCPGIPTTALPSDGDLRKTVRIFPHKMKGEGHYLALLQKGEGIPKRNDGTNEKRKNSPSRIPEAAKPFFEDIAWELEAGRLELRGERLFYMPDGLSDVRGIRFLRTGLLLGELKKNRFEPSQALAMCLKREEYAHSINFSADDPRVLRYLKGETLDIGDLEESGGKSWQLVCVDGFPLGWGKSSGGVLKNKYLPGWRLC